MLLSKIIAESTPKKTEVTTNQLTTITMNQCNNSIFVFSWAFGESLLKLFYAFNSKIIAKFAPKKTDLPPCRLQLQLSSQF